MAAVFKWAFLLFTCSLFFYGLYDYLTNYESNSCEMTYMWETPEYIVSHVVKYTSDIPSY